MQLKKDEAAMQDTNAGKSKVLSDAMRSSAIRMSNDPIEAIAYFMNVERSFDVYKAPTDLKALLIRPYVNDTAKQKEPLSLFQTCTFLSLFLSLLFALLSPTCFLYRLNQLWGVRERCSKRLQDVCNMLFVFFCQQDFSKKLIVHTI